MKEMHHFEDPMSISWVSMPLRKLSVLRQNLETRVAQPSGVSTCNNVDAKHQDTYPQHVAGAKRPQKGKKRTSETGQRTNAGASESLGAFQVIVEVNSQRSGYIVVEQRKHEQSPSADESERIENE